MCDLINEVAVSHTHHRLTVCDLLLTLIIQFGRLCESRDITKRDASRRPRIPIVDYIGDTLASNLFQQFNFRSNKSEETRTILREIREKGCWQSIREEVKEFPR